MLELKIIQSAGELTEISDQWDSLWEQSDSTSPLTRSSELAIWLEHFAEDRTFQAITVWKGATLVAAIPLVVGKKKGWKVAELPNNEWSCSGDLLLAEDCQQYLVIELLIQGLDRINALAIWLDWIRVDQLKWWILQEQLAQRFQAAFAKPRFSVSEILTPNSIDQYQQNLSKNHRKKMKRAMRGLQQAGSVEHTHYQAEQLDRNLDEALAIEQRSWKGKNESSIRSFPRVENYFRTLAHQLDREGFLALEFLRVNDRAIAFDLGYKAKGVRGSHKISFDSEFAKSSPGQVLIGKQIECAARTRDVQAFDSIGPTTEAIRKWTDETYQVGRIFLSNRRWASRVAVGAMGRVSNLLSKLKASSDSRPDLAPQAVKTS